MISSPADIIATAAFVVALLAMIATFWQAAIARRHNRLAVRPLLSAGRTRTPGSEGTRYIIKVQNLGIGTAVIKEHYFEHDGERISYSNSEHPVLELLKSAFGSELPFKLNMYGLPRVGAGMAPNTEYVIFDLILSTLQEASTTQLDEYLRSYALVIEYESLYGESQTVKVPAGSDA